MDHCFYVEEERQKDLAYRMYVTDAIKNINNSIANTLGGAIITKRFAELTESHDNDNIEQDPDEIKRRISDKLDMLGKDNGSSSI